MLRRIVNDTFHIMIDDDGPPFVSFCPGRHKFVMNGNVSSAYQLTGNSAVDFIDIIRRHESEITQALIAFLEMDGILLQPKRRD